MILKCPACEILNSEMLYLAEAPAENIGEMIYFEIIYFAEALPECAPQKRKVFKHIVVEPPQDSKAARTYERLSRPKIRGQQKAVHKTPGA